jgi:hypothetical protein
MSLVLISEPGNGNYGSVLFVLAVQSASYDASSGKGPAGRTVSDKEIKFSWSYLRAKSPLIPVSKEWSILIHRLVLSLTCDDHQTRRLQLQ